MYAPANWKFNNIRVSYTLPFAEVVVSISLPSKSNLCNQEDSTEIAITISFKIQHI